jgi:signal transducing adaptor molecule
MGAGRDSEAEHKAAWDAYYAQQAQAQQQQGIPPQGHDMPQPAYGASPYPSQEQQGAHYAPQGHPGPGGQYGGRVASGHGPESITNGMGRMNVGQ